MQVVVGTTKGPPVGQSREEGLGTVGLLEVVIVVVDSGTPTDIDMLWDQSNAAHF